MGKRSSPSTKSSEPKVEPSYKKTRHTSCKTASNSNGDHESGDEVTPCVEDKALASTPNEQAVLLVRGIVDTTGRFSQRVKAFEQLAKCAGPGSVSASFPKWNENWDGRHGLHPEANRYIYLIRHGQYNLNGATDNERYLTVKGVEQAKYTGGRLLLTGIKFDRLTVSNMTRALETSVQVMREIGDFDMGFSIDCLLREGFPAIPDPPEAGDKAKRSTDNQRIEQAFRKYFYRADEEEMNDTHEIIVCHSNVIRYFLCRAMQFSGSAWLRIALANASISQLQIRADGRVTLRSINETSHLPEHLITFT